MAVGSPLSSHAFAQYELSPDAAAVGPRDVVLPMTDSSRKESTVPLMTNAALPPPILAAKEELKALNVLWVDDKPLGEHTALIGVWAKQCPDVAFHALVSTEELRVWLVHRTTAIQAKGEACIRVITNRCEFLVRALPRSLPHSALSYRERDGAAAAAELLIRWLRNKSPFPRTAVMIYCSNPSGLDHLMDRHTLVSTDIRVCQRFATSLADPTAS